MKIISLTPNFWGKINSRKLLIFKNLRKKLHNFSLLKNLNPKHPTRLQMDKEGIKKKKTFAIPWDGARFRTFQNVIFSLVNSGGHFKKWPAPSKRENYVYIKSYEKQRPFFTKQTKRFFSLSNGEARLTSSEIFEIWQLSFPFALGLHLFWII